MKKINPKINDNLTAIGYKMINGQYLLVNWWGYYVYLTPEEFSFVQSNQEVDDDKLHAYLSSNFFLRRCINTSFLTDRFRIKKRYLLEGPTRHDIKINRRRNDGYVLDWSSSDDSSDASEAVMSKTTADKVLDSVFGTTAKRININLKGGEPLINFDSVDYIIKRIKAKKKTVNKQVTVTIQTNGVLLDRKTLDYFLSAKITIKLPLAGPSEIHDPLFPSVKNHYAHITGLLKHIKEKYPKLAYDNKRAVVNFQPVVTKDSLKHGRRIVDEYAKLGIKEITLSPLDPYGLNPQIWRCYGYSLDKFFEFYKSALDRIIELNLGKKIIKDNFSSIFLTKILTDRDPDHPEWRSPCGAGIGRLSYDTDGSVFTCDEGMALSKKGDNVFRLGNANKNDYEDLVTHPTTRAVCTASCVEALPGCDNCIYHPYCGVCPVYSYHTSGNIVSNFSENARCKLTTGILDNLFVKLQDKKTKRLFTEWVC